MALPSDPTILRQHHLPCHLPCHPPCHLLPCELTALAIPLPTYPVCVQLSTRRARFVAHAVKPFRVVTPPGENAKATNCEGARCFVDNGQLWLEYGSRGGTRQGQPVSPWVVRCPFDPKAVQNGTFAVDPSSLERTYWAATIDNDPLVRQCADMGQAVGMARYGQLFAAAYDDEATETYFRSYVMERLPGAAPGGTEPYKALYKINGVKIEAIMDLTPVGAPDSQAAALCGWTAKQPRHV